MACRPPNPDWRVLNYLICGLTYADVKSWSSQLSWSITPPVFHSMLQAFVPIRDCSHHTSQTDFTDELLSDVSLNGFWFSLLTMLIFSFLTSCGTLNWLSPERPSAWMSEIEMYFEIGWQWTHLTPLHFKRLNSLIVSKLAECIKL